ncbi:hypothetical protein Mal52_13700 [Symmachiella dynata]|uniref:Uncharacterized protein n=1 Tax=Symmachiella dynata TaxID=2527995 RepID=A0A517ZK93_9PLAN|nr:hypothetical protein [Symmachiella dynata]QDU42901.1 hypothetical protein Mal52_13700 [Symmachiella dynata]
MVNLEDVLRQRWMKRLLADAALISHWADRGQRIEQARRLLRSAMYEWSLQKITDAEFHQLHGLLVIAISKRSEHPAAEPPDVSIDRDMTEMNL